MGTHVSVSSIALGSCFIEKHFTLSRADGGVDSTFSLEPHELKELVATARIAQATVGTPMFAPTESESSVLRNRRSLYAVKPIGKGELFTTENVRSIRPANGLPPKYLNIVLGAQSSRDIAFGEPLTFEMIEPK